MDLGRILGVNFKGVRVDQKQQAQLENFFREGGRWTWRDWHILRIIGIVFLVIAGIVGMIPYDYSRAGVLLSAYAQRYTLFFLGLSFYMQKICWYKEDGANKKVYDLLTYFAVSRKQYLIYRLRKMLLPCLCVMAVALLGQNVGAAVFLHSFSVERILEPLCFYLIFPVAIYGYERPLNWQR